MNFLQWCRAAVGKRIDFDHAYGAQCVDLVNVYAQAFRAAGAFKGNAVDIARQNATGWRWVANAPANYPTAGDVVVWAKDARIGTGDAGHTALCLAADTRVLLVLEQNWPTGSPVAVGWHSYDGVLGWQTPAE